MTIPMTKLDEVKRIIVHEKCPDGMASAMILKDVIPDVTPEFVQYSTTEQEKMEATEGMLFCDFSPHRSRVDDFLKVEAIVLDHHAKAWDICKPFVEAGLGVFGNEDKDPGVCGAYLAFEHVWLPMMKRQHEADLRVAEDVRARNPPGSADPTPGVQRSFDEKVAWMKDFATLAGIRDTWQKQHPRFQEASEQAAALEWWPKESLLSRRFGEWENALSIGPVLFQKKLDWADTVLKGARRFTSERGTRVTMFEGLRPTSDAAEKVGQESDIIVGWSIWCEEGDPIIVFSTRSRSNFDCGAFCVAHGGGGHTKAAGFRVKLSLSDLNPYALFENILNRYEAGL